MAIEQTAVTVSGDWVKVATGDCVIQSPNSNQVVEFSLSNTKPNADSDAFSVSAGKEPISIKSLGGPVWVRLKQPKKTPGLTVNATETKLVVAREGV